MDWIVIYQKIIWEVIIRKIWAKLLDLPARGDAVEKGEHKTVRSAQRWFYNLQVIE